MLHFYRSFVPRFPGIPEMLYFTLEQTFWYIFLKAMKYLYNIHVYKTMK